MTQTLQKISIDGKNLISCKNENIAESSQQWKVNSLDLNSMIWV